MSLPGESPDTVRGEPWTAADSLGHQVVARTIRPAPPMTHGGSVLPGGPGTVHARHASFLESLSVRPQAPMGAGAALPLGRVWRRPQAAAPSDRATGRDTVASQRGVVVRAALPDRPVVVAARVRAAGKAAIDEAAEPPFETRVDSTTDVHARQTPGPVQEKPEDLAALPSLQELTSAGSIGSRVASRQASAPDAAKASAMALPMAARPASPMVMPATSMSAVPPSAMPISAVPVPSSLAPTMRAAAIATPPAVKLASASTATPSTPVPSMAMPRLATSPSGSSPASPMVNRWAIEGSASRAVDAAPPPAIGRVPHPKLQLQPQPQSQPQSQSQSRPQSHPESPQLQSHAGRSIDRRDDASAPLVHRASVGVPTHHAAQADRIDPAAPTPVSDRRDLVLDRSAVASSVDPDSGDDTAAAVASPTMDDPGSTGRAVKRIEAPPPAAKTLPSLDRVAAADRRPPLERTAGMPLAARSRSGQTVIGHDPAPLDHRTAGVSASALPMASRSAVDGGTIVPSAGTMHASHQALSIDRDTSSAAPAPMQGEPMSAALVEHPLATPMAAPQPPSSTTAMPQSAAQATPPIDMDEWIDKACAEMMERLSIEQERRGLTAWT